MSKKLSQFALVRVTVAVMKLHDQSNLRQKEGLLLHIPVHHKRKSGQELQQDGNLEAGAATEAMEEFCLLDCCHVWAQPAFL